MILNGISQTEEDKYHMIALQAEAKNKKLSSQAQRTERWGVGGCEMGEDGQKVQTSGYKCQQDVIYTMVTIINNTPLHT